MKLLAILVALMVTVCVPAFAATLLTDSEMGEMYAGNGGLTINEIYYAENSAVAAQSNIGAIAGGGNLSNDSVLNTNDAYVYNDYGGTALALQNNIGVAASLGGTTSTTDITNSNYAEVDNDYPYGGMAVGHSLEAGEDSVKMNVVCAGNSAAAAQSNIGVIVGELGISNSFIENSNWAFIWDWLGDSAVALQNNIGVAASCVGNVDSIDIDNYNYAEVDNYYGAYGWVGGHSLEADGCYINGVLAFGSAIALQSNIAAIYGGGNVTNSAISNVNIASVYNNWY